MDETHTCQAGTYCRGRDEHGQPYPTGDPLCQPCLDHAQPAIRGLVYDYLDLAQLHEASMSQAVNEHTSGGGHESPTLLADHVEALQAELVHAVSLWEHALRAVTRLHNPRTFAPLWRTTVYDHLNLTDGTPALRRARAGAIVQRAVGVIAPRLDRLAKLPAVTVCPTGIEDQPQPMHGWEAVLQLQALHQRARATLGRTRRTFWISGECWHCDARPRRDTDGPLYRAEPRDAGDPMQVTCSVCAATRPYADYEQYTMWLLWPDAATDELVRVSA
ncbi:MAG TPA: hypothetical protein VI172_12530 [Candidatus Dormibacteraeota bacterium]|jgi:hypothetical protein